MLACYDKIVPNAYKADLFRYAVVYVHGGCYADIGFIFIRSYRFFIRSDDAFVSTPDAAPPQIGINSAFFCASQRHPILALAIEKIVRRVQESDYGASPIDVTGPRLLFQAFTAYFRNETLSI